MSDPASIVAGAVEDLILLVYRRGAQVDGGSDPLTSTQRLVLVLMADHGPVRLGALARLAETTEATATRTVTALARLGLAERGRDPVDGRAVLVCVTDAGRRFVQDRRAVLRDSLAPGMDDLGESEGRRLAELLSRVVGTVRTLPDQRAWAAATGAGGAIRAAGAATPAAMISASRSGPYRSAASTRWKLAGSSRRR